MFSLNKIIYQLLTEYRIILHILNIKKISNVQLLTKIVQRKHPSSSLLDSDGKKRLTGSITVETALVLPMFMFAMISILYMANVIWYSDVLCSGLHQCARGLAVKAYALDAVTQNGSGDMGNLAANIALSETYVRNNVKEYLEAAGATEGNIIYARSKLMQDGMIDLISECQINLPYDFFGIGTFSVIDRARVHAFIGYGNGEIVNSEEDGATRRRDQMVMVTETGSVYHTDRNCRHLNVTPQQIHLGNMAVVRNLSNEIVTQCERCYGNDTQMGYAYVTQYGSKYHSTLDCPGLRITMREIPLSEVGNRRLCMDCGR